MLTRILTDLLRAIVTVIGLGCYTRAADVLGCPPPAVSLQIRRLEQLLRIKLLRPMAGTSA